MYCKCSFIKQPRITTQNYNTYRSYAIADIQTPALRRGAAGAPVVAVCSEALCDVAFSSRMSGRDVRDDVIFLLRI